ncbi:MAG TPA: hypothetical protein VHX37_00090 [Acidobacteriaceae bacterium]|jgi:hypothetical protein|nr:hypothetical protein [Acidobacteriaceae bacterium]
MQVRILPQTFIRVAPQALIFGTALAALLPLAGCHVQVDKGRNGDDKTVRIDTPIGGLHVRSDQTSAGDLGLPIYPGAQIAPDREGDKSADVHLGFGQWQLRVKVVTYSTADAQDKVLAFYKNAMGRFGEVLECEGNHAVGTPAMTGEGLTCREDSRANIRINGDSGSISDNDSGLTLRAGSRHHQHILAFKTTDSGTRFSLVELELPTGLSEESKKDTSD